MENDDSEIYSLEKNKVSEMQELRRKEMYLRGEVDLLRNEIKELREQNWFKLSNFFNALIFIRAAKKIIRKMYQILFRVRNLGADQQKSKHLDIDIIIPVYKNLDLLRNLLKSLEHKSKHKVRNLIIVEDSGEDGYSEALNILLEQLKIDKKIISLINNDHNYGFRYSVNKAWLNTESEIIILVNSDVELPIGWSERLLKPFAQSDVALATPLATNSGANLSIETQNKANWRTFDAALSRMRPRFPEACTAIGYCLAIRKNAITTPELFSEEFTHGYGEDTDLHYRIKSAGLKSVVVDNLLVWHKSGASYSTFLNVDNFKNENAEIFYKKWGVEYAKDLKIWNDVNPLSRQRKYLKHIIEKNYNIDYLIVQLSNNTEIGGIQQLNSIYQEMTLRGFDVGTIYLNRDLSSDLDNSKLVFFNNEINKINTKVVIFSGIESFNFIKNADNFNKAKIINFLQGPDYLFPGNEGKLELFKDSLLSADKILSQSPYLTNLAITFGAKGVVTSTLGSKRSVFFDQGFKKEKILLVSTRKDPDKGLRFALPALNLIRESGWTVIGFGDLVDPSLENYFDEFLGRIDQFKLTTLLQKAGLLLDLSIYEGLGLTALEASMCGVLPVLSRKGGIDSLEVLKDIFIYIENPLDIKEIANSVINFDITKLDLIRTDLAKVANLYSWENSIDKIIEEIENV